MNKEKFYYYVNLINEIYKDENRNKNVKVNINSSTPIDENTLISFWLDNNYHLNSNNYFMMKLKPKYNIELINAMIYFSHIKLFSIVRGSTSYKRLTEIYNILNEEDKYIFKQKTISLYEKCGSTSFTFDLLLDLKLTFSDYIININRFKPDSFLYTSKKCLEKFNLLYPIHSNIIYNFIEQNNTPKTIIDYNNNLMASFNVLFTTINTYNNELFEMDYVILSRLLENFEFRYEYKILGRLIDNNIVDNYIKIIKYYIEYLSTLSKNVILNRIRKFSNFKNRNKQYNSKEEILFIDLLYRELINYTGSNDYLLKLIMKYII